VTSSCRLLFRGEPGKTGQGKNEHFPADRGLVPLGCHHHPTSENMED